MSSGPPQRRRIMIRGIVQGVGFRPFVYALARRHGLSGFVGNDSGGVFIEAEGDATALDAFADRLRAERPPLAVIDALSVREIAPVGSRGFTIVESAPVAGASTPVSPDICVCDDCLRELRDPANRRYRYPFINCTNCGPRFTIIQDVPYDRPLTTMREFAMCPACAREYHDPADRRFHAQPTACPVCGPRVWLEHAGATPAGDAAFAAAQDLLANGRIVAVKGVGGFHLACDARNDAALGELRTRKGRLDKPFAIMARDLAAVRALAELSADEAALLESRARPIVLLRRLAGAAVSDLAAPGNGYIGVMLPYTPLHHLLIGDAPLIMTSGNLSDEPIVTANDDARARLGGLADAFLMHDRDIHAPCDDSVVRAFHGHELPVRRSRGYAPYPIPLTHDGPVVLAAGGELKSTFCLARGDYAYLSQHLGDMGNLETLQAFERSVDHFERLFRAAPERVVCDLHPGYLSTQWAERFAARRGLPLRKAQHHHAHVAALIAEHGRDPDTPIIGVALDGTGFGSDGAIWGGEVLIASARSFERAAQLANIPLPGGDAAIRRPYRIALAHLWAAGVPWDDDLAPVQACPPAERRVLAQQLGRNVGCAPTSSMGRWFDAAAALLGVRQTVTYEAQAAIELEALCRGEPDLDYRFDLRVANGVMMGDPAPVWRAMVRDLRAQVAAGAIAARAHSAVARLVLDLALHARARSGLRVSGLTGGVFQNVRLLGECTALLRAEGFEVLTHRRVPPNDGGLALGQALIARATSA